MSREPLSYCEYGNGVKSTLWKVKGLYNKDGTIRGASCDIELCNSREFLRVYLDRYIHPGSVYLKITKSDPFFLFEGKTIYFDTCINKLRSICIEVIKQHLETYLKYYENIGDFDTWGNFTDNIFTIILREKIIDLIMQCATSEEVCKKLDSLRTEKI
ncbi:MAG: hypothetical protein V1871_02035 [Planctomycetota bacterium]